MPRLNYPLMPYFTEKTYKFTFFGVIHWGFLLQKVYSASLIHFLLRYSTPILNLNVGLR